MAALHSVFTIVWNPFCARRRQTRASMLLRLLAAALLAAMPAAGQVGSGRIAVTNKCGAAVEIAVIYSASLTKLDLSRCATDENLATGRCYSGWQVVAPGSTYVLADTGGYWELAGRVQDQPQAVLAVNVAGDDIRSAVYPTWQGCAEDGGYAYYCLGVAVSRQRWLDERALESVRMHMWQGSCTRLGTHAAANAGSSRDGARAVLPLAGRR